MAGLFNLEKEEEVKGFLENLYIEYSYQCHKERDPDGERGAGAGGAWLPCTAPSCSAVWGPGVQCGMGCSGRRGVVGTRGAVWDGMQWGTRCSG
uniref:Uncharacterized protein n=1 Tax=Pelusios castaneus TaxID=367368 RepID=A0A8C8S013_9SAUR